METESSSTPPAAARLVGTMFAVAAAFLLAACDPVTEVSLQAAGHETTVRFQGTHAIENHPQQAVLRGEFGTVTIEQTRIRLEGLDWVAIPADAPVTVNIKRHRMKLSAGPVSMERTINN